MINAMTSTIDIFIEVVALISSASITSTEFTCTSTAPQFPAAVTTSPTTISLSPTARPTDLRMMEFRCT